MNRKHIIGFALAAVLVASAAVMAAVTFDPATGVGFVGKGDVQLVFGWNNKKLQDNAASVEFRAASTVRTTTTWTCDRDAGPQTQERNNTTVTTLQGLIASVARDRNQVTGFILNGFEGDVEEIVVDNDGPAVGSCPTFWTAIDLVEGEPESLGGGLEVNAPGFDWTPIS